MEDLAAKPEMSGTKFTAMALLIAGVIFAGVAPTLAWLEFSGGSENLVVGTVLEMRRGGPWLVPTLNEAPRISKPPLAAWISAGLVSPKTVAALSDMSQRDAAYRELSWQIRWPALAFACFALVAAAWLGRVLVSTNAGLVTAAMMGSTILFQRFGRSMTTDVQLMLWVTIANGFFAKAVLDNRRWLGCIMGGIALGLAFMSKGPVAIAQTFGPVAVLLIWRWWKKRTDVPRLGWMPIIVAASIALAISLPWPLEVLHRMPGKLSFWYNEMTHAGTVDTYRPDPPWVYFTLVPQLMPWAGFFVLGFVLLWRENSDRGVLTISFVLVPILIMACFAEKNDRYLLPMLSPAAVVCAFGFVSRGKEVDGARRFVINLTWIFLAVITIGLAIGGVFGKRLDGGRWWSPALGASVAVGCAFAIAAAWWCERRGFKVLLPGAVAMMIAAQSLFMYGYAKSERGLSDGRPISDAVCKALPADAKIWAYTVEKRFSRVPIDTLIYLNRTAKPATTPTTLPSGPRAMLVHFRGDQKLPEGMENWRLLGSANKNYGTWRVYAPPEEAAH